MYFPSDVLMGHVRTAAATIYLFTLINQKVMQLEDNMLLGKMSVFLLHEQQNVCLMG